MPTSARCQPMSSRAPDAPAALTVEGLTAGYGGPPVVENVSVKARRGAITAIVGPNGAGKSTLLKAIAGLIRPTAGRVFVEGTDVTGQPAERLVRKGLAYIPQVANVFPALTIRENLEMGGFSRKAGVRERIDQLFQLFPDLKGSAHRQANTLSGGQRTMLALARGLVVGPGGLVFGAPRAADDAGAGSRPDGRSGGADLGRAERRAGAALPGIDLGAHRGNPSDQCGRPGHRAEHPRDPAASAVGLRPGALGES